MESADYNKFKSGWETFEPDQDLPFDFQNFKTIVQDDPTLPDSIRQALIAKHQRSLGLVGLLERFKAKSIASALSALDIKSSAL